MDTAVLKEELRKWGSLKVGDQIPNEWGPPLTKLLNEAANKIEELEQERDKYNDLKWLQRC